MTNFNNKTIIVTGGTGSIGSEIVRQLLRSGARQVRVFSRDEHKQHELRQELGPNKKLRYLIGDIRDKDRLDFAFRGVNLCFHAAALKHVPVCEYNPFEAVKTNIVGTQNVIDVSIKNDLEQVVAISTDKAALPESVLGASKLMMERLIIAANFTKGPCRTTFSCVRFGNVLESRGSVIHLWRSQLKRGEPLTITDKRMTRFFMDLAEAVGLIFEVAKLMKGGEIFVLKMKKRTILDFAKDVARRYGARKEPAFRFIGLRPGEKLHEALMTDEECSHTFEMKRMYIITPQDIAPGAGSARSYRYPGARKLVPPACA